MLEAEIRHAVGVILAVALMVSAASAFGEPLKLFVAPDGNDEWSGRRAGPGRNDGPFATLERARDEIRKVKAQSGLPQGGAIVELLAGVYELAAPFALTAEDSGDEASPIVYRANRSGAARVVGGKVLTGFEPVTDAAVLSRLQESARGKVLQTDLKAQGITEYGEVSGGGLELFFEARPMTVARWPNEGFVRIADVLNIDPVDVRGTKGDKGGKFVYEGDRPLRWQDEKDLWLHGYWFWDWSDQRMKVESIDAEGRVITLAPPQHGYGYRKGQWYYALNALSELDSPGEWHLDRETGFLYFYPPSPVGGGEALVSVIPNLITLQEASHVTIQGLLLEASRDTAVVVNGATDSRVVGCTIRNVGGQAVNVSGGASCVVVGCDIYQTAKGGISLSGGDRATLSPAGHYAENNHVHDFARWYRMYHAAVHLSGVGNRASHNLIHDAPHTAIFFGGNDHLIELNEIHSVCHESNDAGAMYAGRNWTMRGTVVRHNYLHHINGFEGRGCVGVYLDDMFCGTTIYGNVFYRVRNAAFIGGGRDNTIENNIFVECNPSVHVDSRAMGWAKYHTEGWVKELQEKRTHLGLKLLEPPYIERYPQLATVETGDPFAPEGNLVARNVHWKGRWPGIDGRAKPFLQMEDNFLEGDPLFVDADSLDFRLRDDSPAYKLGFKRIPVEEIGLYRDASRASWPVQHTVREVPPPPPPEPVRTGPPVEFKVGRAKAPVTVDGTIAGDEWAGADPSQAMVIAQGIRAEPVKPPSRAWLLHDGAALLVAIQNEVDPSKPLRRGDTWGQDDAVEVAIRSLATKDAPLLVLRGYPSGHFESSDEAGAPTAAVKRALAGVEYKAKSVDDRHWTVEWRLPFASLGVDPAKQKRLQFNLSVRKTAPEPFWLMWQGTGACTWEVANAGVIELAK